MQQTKQNTQMCHAVCSACSSMSVCIERKVVTQDVVVRGVCPTGLLDSSTHSVLRQKTSVILSLTLKKRVQHNKSDTEGKASVLRVQVWPPPLPLVTCCAASSHTLW